MKSRTVPAMPGGARRRWSRGGSGNERSVARGGPAAALRDTGDRHVRGADVRPPGRSRKSGRLTTTPIPEREPTVWDIGTVAAERARSSQERARPAGSVSAAHLTTIAATDAWLRGWRGPRALSMRMISARRCGCACRCPEWTTRAACERNLRCPGSSPRLATKSSASSRVHRRHERPHDLRRDLARVDQELLPARVRRRTTSPRPGSSLPVEDVRGDAADLQQLLGRIEEAALRAVRAREAEVVVAFGAVHAGLVVAVAPVDDRVRGSR